MVLDIITTRMCTSSPITFWNPLDILNVETSSFRYGLIVLNQPIRITRGMMLSLWKRGKLGLVTF